MFETLKEQPADKILALMKMFADDPRAQRSILASASTRTPRASPR